MNLWDRVHRPMPGHGPPAAVERTSVPRVKRPRPARNITAEVKETIRFEAKLRENSTRVEPDDGE